MSNFLVDIGQYMRTDSHFIALSHCLDIPTDRLVNPSCCSPVLAFGSQAGILMVGLLVSDRLYECWHAAQRVWNSTRRTPAALCKVADEGRVGGHSPQLHPLTANTMTYSRSLLVPRYDIGCPYFPFKPISLQNSTQMSCNVHLSVLRSYGIK